MSLKNIDKKNISITGLGACLEWFDFSLFIYLSPFLSKAFFPHTDELTSLIEMFGVFAAGFLGRPLGGLLFGSLGDRFGRKKILQLTTCLMALPMFVVAVLPTAATWGAASIAILLAMRLLQGFFVGGEYVAVMIMLAEIAPDKHRGFVSSLGPTISAIGVLLSSTVVTILMHYLGTNTMTQWGWRIPYAIGCILALLSFFLQSSLAESPVYEQLEQTDKVLTSPLKTTIKTNKRIMILVFLLSGFLSTLYYIGSGFIEVFLTNIIHVNKHTVIKAMTYAALAYVFVAPIGGLLSDKIGRKPILIISSVILLLTVHWMFQLLISGESFYVYSVSILMMALISIQYSSFPIYANELFPPEQRFSGIATAYNTGVSVFGGTAPLLATCSISVFHSNFAPCLLFIVSLLAILAILFYLPETHTNKTLTLSTIIQGYKRRRLLRL